MSFVVKSKPLNFTFDGKAYQGFEGDTLASALLRAGVKVIARSFKYHRPRGIMGAGSEEPNALVQIHGAGTCEPNSCLLYTSPSPRDRQKSRMPSSA